MIIKYNNTNINLVQFIVIFILAIMHEILRLLANRDIIGVYKFLGFVEWEDEFIDNWIEI